MSYTMTSSTTVLMTPETFLNLAAPKKEWPQLDLEWNKYKGPPTLAVRVDNEDDLNVTAHDGRHRTKVQEIKDAGGVPTWMEVTIKHPHMVDIRGKDIYGERDVYGKEEERPKGRIGHHYRVELILSREDAVQAYANRQHDIKYEASSNSEEDEKGKWRCLTCNKYNKDDRVTCSVCGLNKDGSDDMSSDDDDPKIGGEDDDSNMGGGAEGRHGPAF